MRILRFEKSRLTLQSTDTLTADVSCEQLAETVPQNLTV